MRPELDPFREKKSLLRRVAIGVVLLMALVAVTAEPASTAEYIMLGLVYGLSGMVVLICTIYYAIYSNF